MGESESHNVPEEERLGRVLAEFLEAEQKGTAPDRGTFLAAHPDLADQLREFFAAHDRMNALAEPMRPKSATNDGPCVENTSTDLGQHDAPAEAPTLPPTQIVGRPTGGDELTHLAAQGRRFGDYELEAEIARGGMGVVYQARQISLNRTVALKMILAGQLANHEDVQRFHAEAEAAANLDHPGIVPIFEVGTLEGQHFFSMGYVEGQSLAERLREGPMPAREAAKLLEQVCEAVQYAHDHGIIHRDLKPANILLESPESGVRSPEEETTHAATLSFSSRPSALDARPRITDFGLAKRLKDDSHLTGTGQILGTPSYMSPEQASGATDRTGPSSDVYSLGAILYQMLTGRPPFQAETPLDTLMQVVDSEPPPPRLLNPNVPRDLEAICLKCLEKDPVHRYPSARSLHDDLLRYLEGETILASSVNVLDRLTRALAQSRHEEHFLGWGLGLMAFGLVIFLAHAAIFVLEHVWQDALLAYWLPRCAMFAVLLILLCRFRPRAMLPKNSAERLIWVVWIGYLVALGVVNVILYVLGEDQRHLYAFSCVLSGFGFLIMGGHVWGGGYLVGLGFLVAAPVLAAFSQFGSLAFGALWAGALFAFGLHYRLRGRAAQAAASAVIRERVAGA